MGKDDVPFAILLALASTRGGIDNFEELNFDCNARSQHEGVQEVTVMTNISEMRRENKSTSNHAPYWDTGQALSNPTRRYCCIDATPETVNLNQGPLHQHR